MRKHKILALLLAVMAVTVLSIVFSTTVEASQYNQGAGMVAIQLGSDPNGTVFVSDPTGGYISYGGNPMTTQFGTGNSFAYIPGTYTSTPVTPSFTSYLGNRYTTTTQPSYSYTGATYPSLTGTTPQYTSPVYAPNYSVTTPNYTTTSPFTRPQPTGTTIGTTYPGMTSTPAQPQSVYYWGGLKQNQPANRFTGATYPTTTSRVTQPQSVYYWGGYNQGQPSTNYYGGTTQNQPLVYYNDYTQYRPSTPVTYPTGTAPSYSFTYGTTGGCSTPIGSTTTTIGGG